MRHEIPRSSNPCIETHFQDAKKIRIGSAARERRYEICGGHRFCERGVDYSNGIEATASNAQPCLHVPTERQTATSLFPVELASSYLFGEEYSSRCQGYLISE